MPLKNYGLLTGKLVAHGLQHSGNPHYILVVRAGATEFRVAVNVHSTAPHGDNPAKLMYQAVNLKGTKWAKSISNKNAFVLCDGHPNAPRLDYIRDGVLKMGAFDTLPKGTRDNSLLKDLEKAATTAVKDAEKNLPYVAVFGTGFPDQDDLPAGPGDNPLRNSRGFTGVDNVHMNQGNYLRVGSQQSGHYQANGTHQDGGILFFQPDGSVLGFFLKFDGQASETDPYGNPTNTGVVDLDTKIKPAVRKKLLKRNNDLTALGKEAAKRTDHAGRPTIASPSPSEIPIAGTSGGTPTNSFIFASADAVDDADHVFHDDDDSQFRNSSFVNNFAKFGVPEPVPGPRDGKYPTMQLSDVLGGSAVNKIKSNMQIVFHMVGDTGAPAQAKLPNEVQVSEAMLRDFNPNLDDAETPKFFFHLGDVVYFYGEMEYYYGQFYKPYEAYPAPIFAIPGNHDGITYESSMRSLDGFINAFCDDKPRHWSAAGGVQRSTMIQPGVYFTLDAPFVSIIGLYSNCSESFGYLDDQQKLFLYEELVRLKPMRESGAITAVLLAVHHSPLSVSTRKAASQSLSADIKTACDQANFWPDAVFSGHAHIYQRMTKTVAMPGGVERQIPYLISGSGGYEVNPRQELDKDDMAELDSTDPSFKLHQFYKLFGYLRVTVTPAKGSDHATLRTEFINPQVGGGHSMDPCTLDLDEHKIV